MASLFLWGIVGGGHDMDSRQIKRSLPLEGVSLA
jgi:hypothetical protein